MVSKYNVEELKAAIKKLKNIVESFRELATANGGNGVNGSPGGSVTGCNMTNVNSDYDIDPRLKEELEELAGLATRKRNSIDLGNFFKYNHGLDDNPKTISELKKINNK